MVESAAPSPASPTTIDSAQAKQRAAASNTTSVLEDGLVHVDGSVFAELFGLRIAYQVWLPPGTSNLQETHADKRILAYPGWLDNSGSWDPLAPYLARAGYCVLALDPPGCGRSDHRNVAVWYHDFDECLLIPEVAELVGWGGSPFVLLAHSRGSNISSTVSGAFPNLIRATVLVETGLGMAGTYISNRIEFGEDRFGTFAGSVEMNRRNRGRAPRVFNALEQAIKHNSNNPTFPKSRQIAEAIVLRHTVPANTGKKDSADALTFSHDTRTYGQVQSRFINPAVNLHFLRGIQGPVMQIMGQHAPMQATLKNCSVEEAMVEYKKRFKLRDQVAIPDNALRAHIFCMRSRVAAVADLTLVELDGKHHLHGDIPEECAKAILPWLERARHTSTGRSAGPATDRRKESGDLDEIESVSHFMNRQTDPPRSGTDGPDLNVAAASYRAPSAETHAPVEEVRFDFFGFQLGGKIWGDKSACRERVIAWCDSRDNCASFDELAGRFCRLHPEYCIVAVDPPGLGHSAHGIPSDYGFGISEESVMVIEIAAELGWETFGLWGHGRGASVVLFAAGGYPKVVTSMVLFDPATTSLPDSWAPSEMAHAYEERKAERDVVLPIFDSREQLQKCMETDPLFPKSAKTARALAERRSTLTSDGQRCLVTDDKRAFRVRRAVLEIPQESFVRAVERVKTPILALVPSGSSRRKPTVQRRRLLEELSHVRTPFTIMHVQGNSHVHSCDPLVEVLPSLDEWSVRIGRSSWRSWSKI